MLKIAIIGPESSGKSTLSRELSDHFKVHFIEEYSRRYLSEIDRPYHMEDLNEIAMGQLDLVKKASSGREQLLLSDTEVLCVLIWSEIKYGSVSPLIKKFWNEQQFDLYLLCDASLPWEYDALREVPNQAKRQEIFELFKEMLLAKGRSFEIIRGQADERKNRAIECINRMLSA